MRFGFPVSNIDVNALFESKGSGCTSEVFDKMQQHETNILQCVKDTHQSPHQNWLMVTSTYLHYTLRTCKLMDTYYARTPIS